jgi:hypothetical protein
MMIAASSSRRAGWLTSVLLVIALTAVPSSVLGVPLEGSFLDSIQIGMTTYNVGNQPDNMIVQPPVTITLTGPASGVVTGQFEGTVPSFNPVTIAEVNPNYELRWGVVNVTTNSYLTNGAGQQIFPTNYGPGGPGTGEGFTQVLASSPDLTFAAWVQFQFDLATQGITLAPGNTYALFALLDYVPNGNDSVPFPPGAGPVPLRVNGQPLATSQIINIANGLVGPPPANDFQQLFESQINAGSVTNMDKIITSVLINVVPEPTSLMLLAGAVVFVNVRRRSA